MRIPIILFVLALFAATPAWSAASGAALFNAHCRPCHDSNGDGKTAAGHKMTIPDLRSNEVQKLTDEDLFQRIGNGATHRQYPHAFLKRGMTESDVHQIINFIRTLKAKK